MTTVKRTMTPDEEQRWTAGGYVKAARGEDYVPTPPPAPKPPRVREVLEVGCVASRFCWRPPVEGTDRCAFHSDAVAFDGFTPWRRRNE